MNTLLTYFFEECVGYGVRCIYGVGILLGTGYLMNRVCTGQYSPCTVKVVNYGVCTVKGVFCTGW
jgi:hypothetical protein